MQGKELQERQEQALFDNRLAQELLKNDKPKELASYLGLAELRLQSGMTAEEIDAVSKRAEEAYKRQFGK